MADNSSQSSNDKVTPIITKGITICNRNIIQEQGYCSFSLSDVYGHDHFITCAFRQSCRSLSHMLHYNTGPPLPFHNIFSHHNPRKPWISIMDDSRAQCAYKDIPRRHPVKQALDDVIFWMEHAVTECFDCSDMIIGDVVILRSLKYGPHQETHIDMGHHLWGSPFRELAMFGMLALQMDTKLAINHTATKHFKDTRTTTEYTTKLHEADIETVTFHTGECILVRTEVAHFGVSYYDDNFRIHFTVKSTTVPEHIISKDDFNVDYTTFFVPTKYKDDA